MKMKCWFFRKYAIVFFVAYTLSVVGVQASSYENKAKQILSATGVKGGLIVHIGCRDGKLTASLRANDRYVVHGLDTNPDEVAGPADTSGSSAYTAKCLSKHSTAKTCRMSTTW